MNEDMKNEAIEMITTACEKYAQNYELAAKTIKEAMDKKYVGGKEFRAFTNAGIIFLADSGLSGMPVLAKDSDLKSRMKPRTSCTSSSAATPQLFCGNARKSGSAACKYF